MFEGDSNQKGKDNRDDRKPVGGGGFMPVSSLLVWTIFIAVMAGLFFMQSHYSSPAKEISQSEFLSKFSSNEVASVTIVINQQARPLTEITGNFFMTDKDGKRVKDENNIFVVHNAWLTSEMVNDLTRSPLVKISPPNNMLMNVVWGLAPFIMLGVILALLIFNRKRA